MNMYAYCKCNPISYVDENGNMPSWAIKVCIGIGVIALSGIVAVATMGTSLACNGLTMLYGAVTGALIGAASGAVFGALLGAAMEGLRTGTLEGALRGAKKGAVNGAADGFMWGAIGGAVSGAINGRFCFVAGTLVMTKEGYKAIEKIEEGEEVLSYNENLGIFEYKEVVEVYKNETKELSHIKTKKDEIVSTPGHSILTSEGWKKAKDIKANDLIKTKEGYERVIEVYSEELEEVENVYNLNVLGYHTYVVGYGLLVVHNLCDIKEGATERVQYNYNGKKTNAYNTGGGKTYYAIDRSKHGGSYYKGFELTKNKKQLQWVGDYDANLNLIIGKHKGEATKIFYVIKIKPV